MMKFELLVLAIEDMGEGRFTICFKEEWRQEVLGYDGDGWRCFMSLVTNPVKTMTNYYREQEEAMRRQYVPPPLMPSLGRQIKNWFKRTWKEAGEYHE